jgi:PncC family amidohydrolase
MEFQKIVSNIKKILLQNNWSIATAESLTAGLVSSHLASISGSSGYLFGGIVAYSIPIKARILGVDERMAEKCNAYSAEVATQMAQGVCKLYGVDIGISTTGYAEPDASHKIEQPQAFVALSVLGDLSHTQIFADGMSRNEARDFVAKKALIFLLETLKARIVH